MQFPKLIALAFVSLLSIASATNSVEVDGEQYVNYGLKGYGFLSGSAIDNYGDTISFGSSITLQKSSVEVSNGVYSFTTYNLPDRGWNTEGTLAFAARIYKYDVTFTPKDESSTQNLVWDLQDTILLKDFNGDSIIGLDCNTTTVQNGVTLPASIYKGDGFGGDLNSNKTTTRVCLDPEAINLIQGDIANGFWVTDEYGPGMYKFNSEGLLTEYISPPDAFLPYRNGKIQYSANSPPIWENYDIGAPDSGRTDNQGFEGSALSPDGSTLFALLQSATIQDGGSKKYTSANTRMLKYDLTGSSPKLVGEYVVQLPTFSDPTQDPTKNPRTAAQSELVWVTDEVFMLLARDGTGRANPDNAGSFAATYKQAGLFSIKDATNIVGLYDGEGGQIASKKGKLIDGVTPATVYNFVNYLEEAELSKFGLQNGGTDSPLMLNGKWEGITLIPVECTTDEYYLLTVSDDDFMTQNGFMNFGKFPYADASGANLDNQALVFHVKLPTLKSRNDLPASCAASSSGISSASSSVSSSSSSTKSSLTVPTSVLSTHASGSTLPSSTASPSTHSSASPSETPYIVGSSHEGRPEFIIYVPGSLQFDSFSILSTGDLSLDPSSNALFVGSTAASFEDTSDASGIDIFFDGSYGVTEWITFSAEGFATGPGSYVGAFDLSVLFPGVARVKRDQTSVYHLTATAVVSGSTASSASSHHSATSSVVSTSSYHSTTSSVVSTVSTVINGSTTVLTVTCTEAVCKTSSSKVNYTTYTTTDSKGTTITVTAPCSTQYTTYTTTNSAGVTVTVTAPCSTVPVTASLASSSTVVAPTKAKTAQADVTSTVAKTSTVVQTGANKTTQATVLPTVSTQTTAHAATTASGISTFHGAASNNRVFGGLSAMLVLLPALFF